MKTTQMIQVEFHHLFERKVVWVDTKWNLKPGHIVEFEGDASPWTVAKVYAMKIEIGSLHKKWGLDLPQSQRTER